MINAQSFGQNKVQYQDFDWSYIQTPHFDIYYYEDQKSLAEFTADVAEESYEQISIHLRWDLKKRVSIMVYNSHNEFQQTNVVSSYMREGVGGVTELFKNRVVFPFEGNYSQFRHVIHHELVHALINDMVYGGSMQHVISSRTKIRVPIWSNEGLAEYLSSKWDTKADMVLRDIAVHERMPSVKELNYFMAYKGGQSLWRFITEKYGREKIGDVFRLMKRTQNAEKGYERALGMNYEDLTKQWHKYLKKEYWPDIKNRDPLEDMSEKITDHKKAKNFYNISPAISPDGSMVAVLSDEMGYFDILLLDAITGKKIKKLIKGNRSVDFEELKWLQPGISWSPDSKRIVLAAKAGKSDALHIIDVENKESEKIELDMNGVFSASWSPNGNQIAFIGQVENSSDVFVLNLDTKSYERITDDIFSDSYPSWNPKGTEIIFTSDRGDYVSGDFNGLMKNHNYKQTDIYSVNILNKQITRYTNTNYNESHPIWSNTEQSIFYTSDYNGVWNLFRQDLNINELANKTINQKEQDYAITNVLTGLQQPTLTKNDEILIFAGYSGIGWDLYSITNPLGLNKKVIPPTNFILKDNSNQEIISDLRRHKLNDRLELSSNYSDWIFAEGYQHFNNSNKSKNSEELVSIDSSKINGEYISKAYKTRFTLDLVSGNLQISNVFGTTGMTYFSFSDILGDHKVSFGTEMVLTLENSDYFFQYAYLKNRLDYYFVGFQTANFFPVDMVSLGRLRHYGFQTLVSHPFSKFQRFDYALSVHNINYSILKQQSPDAFGQIQYKRERESNYSAFLPSFSWVFDNSVFGFSGPIDGFRKNTTLTISPGGKDKLKFQTIKADIRKYWRFSKDYTFAVRAFLGKSLGKNKQKFFLGGMPYLLAGGGETNGIDDNSLFREVILDTANSSLIHDLYFTEYAFPLRGARFAERFGNTTSLINLEIRFPFVNYLALGFPLKVVFGNIRGHAFMDIGAAWDETREFDKTIRYGENNSRWPLRYRGDTSGDFSPWVTTIGLGTKINLGYFLLRIETAWDKNINGYSKPQWYFSLGPDW